jgi:hypothetical protein
LSFEKLTDLLVFSAAHFDERFRKDVPHPDLYRKTPTLKTPIAAFTSEVEITDSQNINMLKMMNSPDGPAGGMRYQT